MNPNKIAAFAIGPIGAAFLGLITLPVITWVFSQEDVGRMAMLQVVLGFSTLLFTLGLDQSYVREFHEPGSKEALLKHALLPGLVLLLTIIALLLSLGGTLGDWLFEVPRWQLSLLVALALVGNFISRFLSLVLRMYERGLAFSMSQLLPKLLLLGIIFGYVVVDADNNLTNLVLAHTAAITFVCTILVWATRAEWRAGFHSKLDVNELRRMLRFGLPLILGGVAFWGLTSLDKVFLRSLSSFEELAVYSVSVSFAAAATILQSVFSTVWAPMVYKWARTGEGLENVQVVSRFILGLVVLIFSLAGMFSWLVTLVLPSNYVDVQWIVVSCIGYPLLYTLSETTVVGIGISRRSAFAMLAAVLALIINLIGNWLLIPIYGASGAAVSTCVAFWIFFLLRTEFSIFVWKTMPRMLLYSYTGICVLGASLFTLWGPQLGRWGVVFWGAMLASCFLVFRAELRKAWGFLIRRK